MLDYPCGDAEGIRGQWAAFEEMKTEGGAKSLAVSSGVRVSGQMRFLGGKGFGSPGRGHKENKV
eukprot:717753-Prorocentrum_minimum.AAC.1